MKCMANSAGLALRTTANWPRQRQLHAISMQPRVALTALQRGALPAHGRHAQQGSRRFAPPDATRIDSNSQTCGPYAPQSIDLPEPLPSVSQAIVAPHLCSSELSQPGAPCPDINHGRTPFNAARLTDACRPAAACESGLAPVDRPTNARTCSARQVGGRAAHAVGECSEWSTYSCGNDDAALIWTDLEMQARTQACSTVRMSSLEVADCKVSRRRGGQSMLVVMNPLHDADSTSRDMESLGPRRCGSEAVHSPTDHLREDVSEAGDSSQASNDGCSTERTCSRRLGPLWRCMLCDTRRRRYSNESTGSQRDALNEAAATRSKAASVGVCEGVEAAGGHVAALRPVSPRTASNITFTPADMTTGRPRRAIPCPTDAGTAQAACVGSYDSGATGRPALVTGGIISATTTAGPIVPLARTIGRADACPLTPGSRRAAVGGVATSAAPAVSQKLRHCSSVKAEGSMKAVYAGAVVADEARRARRRGFSERSAGRLHAHTVASAARARATSARVSLVTPLGPGAVPFAHSARSQRCTSAGLQNCVVIHTRAAHEGKPAHAAKSSRRQRSLRDTAAWSIVRVCGRQSFRSACCVGDGSVPATGTGTVAQYSAAKSCRGPKTLPNPTIQGSVANACVLLAADRGQGHADTNALLLSSSLHARVRGRERLEAELGNLEALLRVPQQPRRIDGSPQQHSEQFPNTTATAATDGHDLIGDGQGMSSLDAGL